MLEVVPPRILQGLWRHGAFRKLWAAQSISLLGSQVTTLALPLAAVLTLQASALEMGLLRVATSLPGLLFSLVVGVWVDRLRRRPLLIGADIGRAALLASIPVAAVFHHLTIVQMYVVAFLTGALTILFDVAQSSLLPSLVERADLVEGNSKLELSRASAMILGPGLAGLLVQALTAPIAIIADALSFVGSALFLGLIRTHETSAPDAERAGTPQARQARRSLWSEARDGLRIVLRHPILQVLATSLALFNLFSAMLGALYVLYLTRALHIAPGTVGVIYAIGSIGFPIGAALSGRVARRLGIGPTIVWGAGLSDAGFLLAPLAPFIPFMAVPLLIAGNFLSTLAGPITAITQQSLRQAVTSDEVMGRVNGTMRFVAAGLAPFGGLLAGTLGDHLGLFPTVVIAALGIQLGFVRLLVSPIRRLRTSDDALSG